MTDHRDPPEDDFEARLRSHLTEAADDAPRVVGLRATGDEPDAGGLHDDGDGDEVARRRHRRRRAAAALLAAAAVVVAAASVPAVLVDDPPDAAPPPRVPPASSTSPEGPAGQVAPGPGGTLPPAAACAEEERLRFRGRSYRRVRPVTARDRPGAPLGTGRTVCAGTPTGPPVDVRALRAGSAAEVVAADAVWATRG